MIRLKGVTVANPEQQATTATVVRFYKDWLNKKNLCIHSSDGVDRHGNIAPAEFILNQEEFNHYSVIVDPDDTPWLKPLTVKKFNFIKDKPDNLRSTTEQRNFNLGNNGAKKGEYMVDENGDIILENEHRIRLVEIIVKPKVKESDL